MKSKIACLILNRPALRLPGSSHKKKSRDFSREARPLLEERIRVCSKWPIAIMTPAEDVRNLQSFLRTHNFFGIDSARISVFPESKSRCNLRRTGEPASSTDAGSFSAIPQLFETGLVLDFLDMGVEYIYISFASNEKAQINTAALGMMELKKDYDLFVEVTERMPADRDPILLRQKEGDVELYEIEEIDQELLRQLGSRREYVGGSATNTYYLRLSGLMAKIRSSFEDVRARRGSGYFGFDIGRLADPLYFEDTANHEGLAAEILCPDVRISRLAAFLKTLYLEGAPRSWLPVEGEERGGL